MKLVFKTFVLLYLIGNTGYSQTSNPQGSSMKSSSEKSVPKVIHVGTFDMVMKRATLREIVIGITQRVRGLSHLIASNADTISATIDIDMKGATVKEVMDYLKTRFPINYIIRDARRIEVFRELKVIVVAYEVYRNKQVLLPYANVLIQESKQIKQTDSAGSLEITLMNPCKIQVSYTGKKTEEKQVDVGGTYRFVLENVKLKDIQVVTNGYFPLYSNRRTASYYIPKIAKVKANGISNIIELTAGSVLPSDPPGVSTPHGLPGALRGPNTYNGNPEVLLVMKDFSSPVDFEFYNPNDMEAVTILKDPTSLFIYGPWGTNGALVYTPKMARFNEALHINAVTRLTVTQKPSLGHLGGISAADFVDLENHLFSKQSNPGTFNFSPVQDLLNKWKAGIIPESEAVAQLNYLKEQDLLGDIRRYLLENGILHQHAISLQAGSPSFRIYASVGMDVHKLPVKGNETRRLTNNLNIGYKNKKFEGEIFTYLSARHSTLNRNQVPSLQPYLSLKDSLNNPLPVPYKYPGGFLEQFSSPSFMDWKYYPLREAEISDNKKTEFLGQFSVKGTYQLRKDLAIEMLGQHITARHYQQKNHLLESFYVRDLINTYLQPEFSPIPKGNIMDKSSYETNINYLRSQLNFIRKRDSLITFFSGAELKNFASKSLASRIYGSNLDWPQDAVDYQTAFRLNSGSTHKGTIPYINKRKDSLSRFLSFYGNIIFRFDDKYVLSLGIRKDLSNLFALQENKSGPPTWAAGFAWSISEEKFYKWEWLDFLNFRLGAGKTGNMDISAVPFNTIELLPNNSLEPVYALNPSASRNLRYERLFTFDAGLDFKVRNRYLSGSIDYYKKYANNLIQEYAINPTSGQSSMRGNYGKLIGWGIDLQLKSYIKLSRNFNSTFEWLYQLAHNKVASSQGQPGPAWKYADPSVNILKEGYPSRAIFALRFGGLDPRNGDPIGFLHNKKSTEYEKILEDTSTGTWVYMGSAVPTSFASMVHTIQYKSIFLSYMLGLKAGYYVWKQPLNYYAIYNLQDPGTADYGKRWQQPGDEQHTDVPSINVALNQWRDRFYGYAEPNVIPGDHIRINYIQFGFQFKDMPLLKGNVKSLTASVSLNNVGIIWRANSDGIDPDIPRGGLPSPRSLTLSVSVEF